MSSEAPERLGAAQHYRQPWRVHELARDFALLDVWGFPIRADPARARFADFVRILAANGAFTDNPFADALLELRTWLGRAFGWDRNPHSLPIPGCREKSVAERLPPEDRRTNRADDVHIRQHRVVDVRVVYLFPNELLMEVSNQTVHGLIHFGWVDTDGGRYKTPRMAIYVKSRGLGTDLYLRLVKPFRYLVFYPAWVRRITRLWREFAER